MTGCFEKFLVVQGTNECTKIKKLGAGGGEVWWKSRRRWRFVRGGEVSRKQPETIGRWRFVTMVAVVHKGDNHRSNKRDSKEGESEGNKKKLCGDMGFGRR